MMKFDGRTKSSAEKQINESHQRLQADHVDLLQFHEIVHDDDPDRIFAKGGAVEAMIAAQKAGKTRYVGFHRPQGSGHPSEDAACGRRARL